MDNEALFTKPFEFLKSDENLPRYGPQRGTKEPPKHDLLTLGLFYPRQKVIFELEPIHVIVLLWVYVK